MLDNHKIIIGKRLLLLSSRSWGELGNYLSAKRLEKRLKTVASIRELIHENFEDYCPYFSELGERISTLSRESHNAEERNNSYNNLMREIENTFYKGFEMGDERIAQIDIPSIRERIVAHAPDIVVGTKGLISRICVRAVKKLSHRPLVINYVTNDGLLNLPIHLSDAPDQQLVQTDLGRRSLTKAFPQIDSSRITITGPFVTVPKYSNGSPLTVGIFINRGGSEYWPLLETLALAGDRAEVQIICIGNDNLLSDIKKFSFRNAPHWCIESKLPPKDYLSRLDSLARFERRVFICKSAPSTVFEALARRIPVLTLNSGLPMEKWVGDLVKENGLGGFYYSVNELNMELMRLIDFTSDIPGRFREGIDQFLSHNAIGSKAGANIAAAFSAFCTLNQMEDS